MKHLDSTVVTISGGTILLSHNAVKLYQQRYAQIFGSFRNAIDENEPYALVRPIFNKETLYNGERTMPHMDILISYHENIANFLSNFNAMHIIKDKIVYDLCINQDTNNFGTGKQYLINQQILGLIGGKTSFEFFTILFYLIHHRATPINEFLLELSRIMSLVELLCSNYDKIYKTIEMPKTTEIDTMSCMIANRQKEIYSMHLKRVKGFCPDIISHILDFCVCQPKMVPSGFSKFSELANGCFMSIKMFFTKFDLMNAVKIWKETENITRLPLHLSSFNIEKVLAMQYKDMCISARNGILYDSDPTSAAKVILFVGKKLWNLYSVHVLDIPPDD